ncbi:hypothetical protein J2W34_000082 [Variovorax boronicumulans]|uniref:hypothetical protein n=1 Tax=Variovorax boronicumulans TaxID=436515 RepID=UPI0027820404|nr:hypothetical protein [Variovorax boronicumulans]MDQ0068308.1 hypothetical protein [Variovorax boronicumulans]
MTMANAMHVFTGANYDFGEVGVEIGKKDSFGKVLHTGDIVMLAHGDYLGTDLESWTYDNLLSVIVTEPETGVPFVMGIKDCGFEHPEWRIQIVKKFGDVVDGERWPDWGFNYRSGVAA